MSANLTPLGAALIAGGIAYVVAASVGEREGGESAPEKSDSPPAKSPGQAPKPAREAGSENA